ncbi:phage tail protein [Oceaniovalibus sp. ACAM 378]|uniref:phage tail protein n=1 Tax=Oceaniovalibus sp. ACAM 378 TaxID=2599923 RepID=UPI0011D96DC9|nr:phage tail protein [Oceaniovalibus sp. ACAM 378]TYB83975.1 DUF1983 domain-containing protein [Oceaniovalibus sp. ACAM 378]
MAVFTAIGAAVSSFFAGLTWASVGTFLLRTVASMGLSMLAQKLAGKDKGPSFGVKGQLERGADVPQAFILGAYATAGSLTYGNTAAEGGTPNAWMVWVITLSDLPVSGLTGLWVNGARVVLESSAGWLNAPEYVRGGKNYLQVRFYDGTQATADPFLVNDVSTEERPWDADAVGFGKAYAVVRARIDQEFWRNGFPRFLFEIDGARLYDPSKDTTVGGTGAHRWSDPATWETSENVAVQIYNILRGMSYRIDRTGGIGVDAQTVSLDGANTLSLRVVGGGGSEADDLAKDPRDDLGIDGTETTVILRDGATVIKVWTAQGGVAAAAGTDPSQTPMSPLGDGAPPIFGTSSLPEFSYRSRHGGTAGQYIEIVGYDISDLTDPTLTFNLGTGGRSAGAGGAIFETGLSVTEIRWLYGLQGVTEAQLPVDHWIQQISKCRGTVSGTDGPEPRFRSSGEVPVSAAIVTVIEGLLDACNGRLSDAGGVYKLFAGAPDAPVMSFGDDDIISTSDQTFTPFLGLADTVNGVAAKYPSPDAGWQAETAPPLYSPDYEAEDGGRRLLVDVSLDWVPYPEQVQRLMLAALNEARRARRHTFTLPPRFWPLEPGDVVEWTSERNGYVTKQFRVDGMIDLANADIMLDLTEIDPSDYDFDTAVDFTPPAIPGILPQPLPAQDVGHFAVVAVSLAGADGTSRRPAIWAYWDGDVADVRAIKFQIRVKATGVHIDPVQTNDVAESEIYISTGVLPATEYEVRAKFIPASARPTNWTAWKSVITDDTRLTPADVGDDIWTVIEADATGIAQSLIDGFNLDIIVPNWDRINDDIADVEQLIADVRDRFPPIIRDIELQDIARASVYEAVGTINERVIWLLANASDTTTTIRDAGIYVDPEDGTVRIAAVERTAEKISETEIRLNAAEANINLRATQSYVNQVVSDAILDPSQIPLLGELDLRVSNVEIDLDAVDTAINLKADETVVDGIGVRLTQAEVDIDGLDGEIALKVNQVDFDAAETRISDAEIELSSIDGASIKQTVSDTRSLFDSFDALSVHDLAALLDAYEGRELLKVDLAYATQDMRAYVDDERVATASFVQQLGVRIDDSVALVERETSVRSSETEAMAQDIVALDGRVEDAESGLVGQAKATSGLIVRVGATEDDLAAYSESFLLLEGRVGAAEDGASLIETSLKNNYYSIADVDLAMSQATLDLKSTMEGAGGSVTAAQDAAQAASDLAGGKGRVFFANNAPTGADRNAANLWIDTSQNKNQPNRWNGTAWVPATDKVATEAAAAAAAVKGDLNTLTATLTNDYYTITNADLAMAQATLDMKSTMEGAGGSVMAAQQAAQAASDLAGGKGRVFFANNAPTGADRNAANLWIDTSQNKNQPNRWSGTEWVPATDKIATEAAAAAAAVAQDVTSLTATLTNEYYTITAADYAISQATTTLQATMEGAGGSVNAAQQAAQAASDFAGGKGRVFFTNTAPTGDNRNSANLWIDTSGGKNQPHRWNGSNWVAATDSIASDAAAAAAGAQGAADKVSADLSSKYTTTAGLGAVISAATLDLSTTVGEHSTEIGTALSSIGGIKAEYTLRIDNNGIVSGMTLRSDIDDMGKPASQVGFVADKFAITSAPSSNQQISTPFIVYTTPQVIGGVSIPAGVYMKDATIRNGAIGRAKISDSLQSDNYSQDAKGQPTQGMRLNFKTGEVKAAGLVISRPLILARGSFVPAGRIEDGARWRYVNTGIRIGQDDVWSTNRVALVAEAKITTGVFADEPMDPNNSFWSLETEIMSGARWNGFVGAQPQPTIAWQKTPAVTVDPVWATGISGRVFLRIGLDLQGPLYLQDPTIEWAVFQVT